MKRGFILITVLYSNNNEPAAAHPTVRKHTLEGFSNKLSRNPPPL
jgi:hypothetical protein